MDDWDVEHTVLRRRQQELLREAENPRLVRALSENRKASHEDRRSRKVLSIAAILARVIHKV
jgi:hypothetical protein